MENTGLMRLRTTMQTLLIASLLILMTAIYRQDDDSGSHYIHPRHSVQFG
ncbi:hypothetical protein KR074_000591 [Drosophila pseudoananassae]|nr:hypothetical protein KR074_000591 [Drosophila pseudoananassae]